MLPVWSFACFRWSFLRLKTNFTEIDKTFANYITIISLENKQYIGDKKKYVAYFPLVVSKPDALELASCWLLVIPMLREDCLADLFPVAV